MLMSKFNELKAFLETPKNIVVIGHRNPDGDAVGSCLALSHYFNKKGHNSIVVMPNDFPDFLKWLPKSERIYRFDGQNHQSERSIRNSEIIFLLDFNALHRLGDDMGGKLASYPNDFAMIDHHQQPDSIAKYLYSDTSICSTSQMVFHFIEAMDDLDLIDEDIATCIYTGIMTDTGSFRFRSTTSITHKVIAYLIDRGAQNDRIHSNVYDANSYNRLLLLGQSLSNLKILPEYKTAYITLSQEEKDRFNYQKGDTEGVVNYALSVKGISFGVIFIEDKEQGIIKISFRSKGSFSVNQFARNHFNGGGHDNAAGGKSFSSLAETIKEFEALLPTYQNELMSSYEE